MNSNGIKIVTIGDSITYGYPYEPALSWFNIAIKKFNIKSINRGINGDTTDGMLSRFERDVLRYNPSHVIIMGGTNDAYAGIAVEDVINNIRDMVELAAQNDIIPVLGLPIPCNDFAEEQLLEQYCEEMLQFVTGNNIEIIDFHKAMAEEKGKRIKSGLYCDDVHPNGAGYEAMAGIATKIIVKVLIDARVHDYYWNEDVSCTITTLKILSEIFHCELDPQVIEAAYGLNAGRLGSQCGLVEGTLMFIGVYGKDKGLDSQEIAGLCHKLSSEFQDQFGSVLCKELRPQGFSIDNPPHLCEQLTKSAVVFVTEFIFKYNMLTLEDGKIRI